MRWERKGQCSRQRNGQGTGPKVRVPRTARRPVSVCGVFPLSLIQILTLSLIWILTVWSQGSRTTWQTCLQRHLMFGTNTLRALLFMKWVTVAAHQETHIAGAHPQFLSHSIKVGAQEFCLLNKFPGDAVTAPLVHFFGELWLRRQWDFSNEKSGVHFRYNLVATCLGLYLLHK